MKLLDHVKWGMIGCGDVTEKKSGPAFNKIADSQIVSVMRRDVAKANDYAARHQIEHYTDNAQELIENPAVNAIYVATPPDTHADYAVKALKAGKPVYVEKPMALNDRQCEDMLKAAEENNVPLFVAYYRRMLPEFLKIKELISNGAIGQVRLFNIQLVTPPRAVDFDADNLPWRVKPEIAGGGYFFDMAPHQLDLVEYLVAPFVQVTGLASNHAGMYPAEDTISAVFELENGISGTGSWTFTANEASALDRFEIVGDQGTLSFSCFDHHPVILRNNNGTEEFIFDRPDHIQQPMIESVVKALTGKGQSPSDAISAARTNAILAATIQSYYIE